LARSKRTTPREVFLSHAAGDRRFADRLAVSLRQSGVKVWYSETQLHGADVWYQEIGAALRRCDWLIVVLSPASLKSRWVRHEVLYALNEPRYDGQIVPVLQSDCDYTQVFWSLGNLQRIDFRPGRPWNEACSELLRVWGIRSSGGR
jgi:hypothetical protein